MASENAKAVAQEVIKKVRKGQKVDMGDIILEQGYAESVSKKPDKVTRTQSYQKEISPIVVQMERERQRILRAMERKDLDKEQYKILADAMDKMTKNIQLLSGGVTENIGMIPIYGGISRHDSDAKDIQPKEENPCSSGGDISKQDG